MSYSDRITTIVVGSILCVGGFSLLVEPPHNTMWNIIGGLYLMIGTAFLTLQYAMSRKGNK